MIGQATIINYSENESQVFGRRFARFDIPKHFNDWNLLRYEIEALKIDFLRLKISDPNHETTNEILQLGKKTYLLEILRHYSSSDLLQNISGLETFSELEYKIVNHQNIEQFKQIVDETYEDIPFGTYTSNEILDYFPLDKQKNNLVDYFGKQYNGDNPQKEAYIIYLNDIAAGCIITDYLSDYSYTNYLGILRPYRKNDLFSKTFHFVVNTAMEKKLKFASSSARLHNIFSQRGFEKYWNFKSHDWIYLVKC